MKSANLKSSFNSQNNNLYIMTMSDSSYSKFDYNNLSTKENDELSQYLRISSANSKPRKKKRNNLILNAGLKDIPTIPNFSLEYLPKNKILKNNNNFFKTTTQYTHLNKKEEKANLERIKRDCKIILNEKNKIDEKEEINKHSETDAIKYRTEFILKYAKIANYFKGNHSSYIKKINEDRKNEFNIIYNELNKLYAKSNRIILDEIKSDSLLEYQTWKGLLSIFYNYTNNIVKMIDFLFIEIDNLSHKNLQLNELLGKKNNDISELENHINQLNNFISKYKINQVFANKKKNENFKLETNFLQKENSYIITIYKLEEEIRNLTDLLKKNTVVEDKIKVLQNDKDKKIKELDSVRNNYNKEMNENQIKMGYLRDQVDTLKLEREELQTKLKELKTNFVKQMHQISDLEKEKEEYLDYLKEKDAKIKKLKDEIYYLHNQNNNNNNMFIDIPVNTVMTTSHNV